MARACILTLDAERGGVPALVRVVYDLLIAADHSPELLCRASEDVPTSSRWAALKFFLTTPPVHRIRRGAMPGWAVADYPVPPRYQYHLPRLARAVWNAPLAAVVAGSSHTGLPLALARRPYVLWVATLYSEELQSRADVGDVWAAGLIHSSDWPMLEAQEQLVYERAGVILGLSLHTTEMIAARWPGVRPKLRTVVYPVDIERFQPGAAPADPPYILLTARIRDPRKNVNLLLRSFARVRTSFQRVRLIIAGDEPSLDTEHLAAELGLGEAVRFVGHVSPDELSRLYQQATLFVFPSRQEGLGISVLEAMACGLPVVCTRCGGPEGLILDNVTGRLTPNGDEAALANAIIDLLRQPQRAQAMGAAGRARAVNEFARSHVETQLRAAFKDVFGDAF